MESLLNTGKPGSSEARAVLEAMMEGIAVLEGEKYRWMNGHHAAMYGWRPDELIGKTWRELYVPAEQQWIERHAFPELQARGTWRGDVVGRKKDGTPTEVEISLALSPKIGRAHV